MTRERLRCLPARVTLVGCGSVLVFLTACASATLSAAPTTTPADDLAAPKLDVKATVEQVEPWVTNVPVDITFLSNGLGVKLEPGDSVKCNGVQLRVNPSDDLFPHMYRGNVPRVPAGGVYEFAYSHRGAKAVVRAPALPGPKIISPQPGAQLARTPKVTITYEAGTSAGISGEINQSQGLFGGAFATSSGQPDNGTYSMSIPRGLQPGSGWIILYRAMALSPSGTGFKSVRIVDNAAVTGVQVQWH